MRYLRGIPLQENISIKTLDISMNGIGRQGAESIGSSLKVNRSLRTLKMRACRINVDGLLMFFTNMVGNDTLRALDVRQILNQIVVSFLHKLNFSKVAMKLKCVVFQPLAMIAFWSVAI